MSEIDDGAIEIIASVLIAKNIDAGDHLDDQIKKSIEIYIAVKDAVNAHMYLSTNAHPAQDDGFQKWVK